MRRAPPRISVIALMTTLSLLVPACTGAVEKPPLSSAPDRPDSAEAATGGSAPRDPALETDSRFDAMIDAVANRVNTVPHLTDPGTPHSSAIFSEAYDLAEQIRVATALGELNKHVGNELWPRLVAHATDERYAFTYEWGNGAIINASVGQFCRFMAYGDLEFPFTEISPLSGGTDGPPLVSIQWPDDEPASKWCEKRKGKQLYELQIELCERVVADPAAVEELSPQQRTKFIKELKERINILNQSHKPIVNTDRFHASDGEYAILSKSQIETFQFRLDWPGLRSPGDVTRPALLSLFDKLTLQFADKTLQEVATALADASKQKVTLDDTALQAAGIGDDLRFLGTFRDVPLHTVLTSLLEPKGLDYEVAYDGRIVITSLAGLPSRTVAERNEHIINDVYDVFDVVADENELENLAKRFREECPAKSWEDGGGVGSLTTNAPLKKIYVHQTRSNIITLTQLLRDVRASRKKEPPK